MKHGKRDDVIARIAAALSCYDAVMPSRHDLIQYAAKRVGPVTLKVSPLSREFALLVYETARHLPDPANPGRKKFMSARMMNGDGKIVRRFVQMPLGTDDQRRGIVQSMAEVAIRQIHATNRAAEYATALGTQIPLPFPDYMETDDAAEA